MTTTTKPTQSPHRRVQEMVADRIIKLLDRGELPPWEKAEPDSENPAPINGARLQPYRGINRWLALMTREEMGYQDPRWLTPKQAEQLGGGIREGEVDTKFVFWSRVTRESRENPGQEEAISFLRSYRVFNLEQTRNCAVEPLPERGHNTVCPEERADVILFNMPHPPGLTAFEDGTEGPRYLPASDQVRIPQQLRRLNPESWYNAVFHQLVHSTGHPARLGRFELDQPASDRPHPDREELAAAMGAGLLASRAGIGSRALDLRASFFRDWREAIDRDKPMVIRAAAMAQKAVDHILREKPPEYRHPGG